jgi:hypothetical protein
MDSFVGFWLRSLSLCLELATDSNVQLISAILPLDLSRSLSLLASEYGERRNHLRFWFSRHVLC